MFCNNCGTKNDEGTRFCMECGMPMNTSQPEPMENPMPPVQDAYQAPYQQPYQQPQYQAPQQPQQYAYAPAAPVRRNPFLTYDLPQNTIVKLPFPSFVLKFIRLGLWTSVFSAIFYAWAKIWIYRPSLFSTIFGSWSGLDAGFLRFVGILTLLTVLGGIGINVYNMFAPKKLPIPKLIVSAAPAVMTTLFIFVALVTRSASPRFGAWFTLFLTLADTAAVILFMWDKSTSLFKD